MAANDKFPQTTHSDSVFARIERGQGADLGKGQSIILRALLRVILHFEGTMGKITYLPT